MKAIYLIAGLVAMGIIWDYDERYGALFALLIVFGILTTAKKNNAIQFNEVANVS